MYVGPEASDNSHQFELSSNRFLVFHWPRLLVISTDPRTAGSFILQKCLKSCGTTRTRERRRRMSYSGASAQCQSGPLPCSCAPPTTLLHCPDPCPARTGPGTTYMSVSPRFAARLRTFTVAFYISCQMPGRGLLDDAGAPGCIPDGPVNRPNQHFHVPGGESLCISTNVLPRNAQWQKQRQTWQKVC